MLRQDRHQPENERQFAVVAAAEVKTNAARVEFLGLGYLGIKGAVIGPAVIAQQLPGKNHIVGGHWDAVGKASRRIEGESDVAARLVGLDRARQQAVEGERLVIATRHQAFEDVAADRLGGETLDDERIEAVEGAEHALHHAAALRRIGIDIVGRGKPVGHRRSPVHGDGVGRLRPSRRRLADKRERAAQGNSRGGKDGRHRHQMHRCEHRSARRLAAI